MLNRYNRASFQENDFQHSCASFKSVVSLRARFSSHIINSFKIQSIFHVHLFIYLQWCNNDSLLKTKSHRGDQHTDVKMCVSVCDRERERETLPVFTAPHWYSAGVQTFRSAIAKVFFQIWSCLSVPLPSLLPCLSRAGQKRESRHFSSFLKAALMKADGRFWLPPHLSHIPAWNWPTSLWPTDGSCAMCDALSSVVKN